MESVPHWTLAVYWCEARLVQVQPVLTTRHPEAVGQAEAAAVVVQGQGFQCPQMEKCVETTF